MGKLKNKILLILLISIILCSVQAIAAEEISDVDSVDVFDLSNDIETVEAEAPDEVLTADPGDFTELQREVNNAGSTLELNKSYTKKSDESQIMIVKGITIDGKGNTLDGNFINSFTGKGIMSINSPRTVTLKNINFVNSIGSAIDIYSNVNIINCTFKDCKGVNGIFINNNQGAALYIDDGNVNIDQCEFIGNNATQGSAIYNTGKLTISNSKFLENQADARSINLDVERDPRDSSIFHKFIITFTGEDNLINGIYTSTPVTLDNVTYWGEDGETTTSSTPARTLREEGITVNLVIYRGNQVALNITAVTNASGQAVFTNTTVIDEQHLEPGRYEAYAYHYADEYYTYIHTWTDFEFNSNRINRTTVVSNETVTGQAGDVIDSITFDVTRTGRPDPVKNGTLSVTIGDKTYTSPVKDGKATFTNVVLPDASGNFTVNYDNTSGYYWKSSGNLEIIIDEPIDTTVSNVTASGNVGEDIVAEFTVKAGDEDVTGGKLTVTVNGKDYEADVEDGKAKFTFNLDEEFSENNIEVSYSGTSLYKPSTGFLNLTVSKVETFVSDVTVVNKTGRTVEVIFDVMAADESTVNEGKITFTFEGTDYEANVEDGKATFEITLPKPGDYSADVTYSGSNLYASSEGKLDVTSQKLDVKFVSVTPIDGKTGETVQVTMVLVDEFDNPVLGGTVTYTIDYSNPKSLGADDGTVVTDGEATVDVKLGAAGTYPAKASYTGNDIYNDAEQDEEAVITEDAPDDDDDDSDDSDDGSDDSDDSSDDSDDGSDDSDDGSDDSEPTSDDSSENESASEPTASKTVAAGVLATGNPIAMLLLVLLSLVSTISIRRQK